MINNFDNIYNETYNTILAYVISKIDNFSDIEDVMQSTYTRLFKVVKKNKYKIDKPKAFCLDLARKEMNDHYRKVFRKKEVINEVDFSTIIDIDKKTDTEELVISRDKYEKVLEFLKSEDIAVQKVMALYYWNDLRIKDISKLLDISESDVKNKIYRTSNKIREVIL